MSPAGRAMLVAAATREADMRGQAGAAAGVGAQMDQAAPFASAAEPVSDPRPMRMAAVSGEEEAAAPLPKELPPLTARP